jgi:hypothetical protein
MVEGEGQNHYTSSSRHNPTSLISDILSTNHDDLSTISDKICTTCVSTNNNVTDPSNGDASVEKKTVKNVVKVCLICPYFVFFFTKSMCLRMHIKRRFCNELLPCDVCLNIS